MENLEQFLAKRAAELEKKKQELEEFSKLGAIPGLDPWLIHGKLYGFRHIAFKLSDINVFFAWAKENCRPVYAVEGRYRTFRPEIPKTRDYADAQIAAEGDVVINYSSISRRFDVEVYTGCFEVSFEIPASQESRDLMPIAYYKSYAPRYYGERKVETWKKTGAGIRQYLRLGVDKQSADLETLLTWEQFADYFVLENKD